MPISSRAISLALLTIPFVFLLLFYFYPLGSILIASFSRADGGLISTVLQTLESSSVRNVWWFTFWQASLSTILTLFIGLPGAYLFARYQFHGKSILQALTSIPFILPTLVVAAAFNALLGSRGWVNLALMSLFDLSQPPIQFINTFSAIILAHIFYNTTIVLRMVGDFWSHIDPRTGQAAQILGANRWQTLIKITLPILLPAIAAATLLIFIFNFTSFGVILILGGPRFATLEVEIYYQTVSLFNLPLAATLSVLQLACTMGLTIIYTRLIAKISRPISIRPRKYTQQRLNTWPRRIMAALIILSLVILLITPLVALVARSFTSFAAIQGQKSNVSPRFTLDFYKELTTNNRDSLFYTSPTTAIAISFGYAAITVILAISLGLPAAWALVRDSKSKLNRSFDSIIMLPLGTSAVTLGLGFIIALSHPPLDLRASLFLIPIAHTLVAFPFVVRSLTPALRSIQPGLRNAAKVMGASPIQVFRHIDLPLIGRALLVAATFAFAISLGEFGATALIARPEYPTIPILIYRFISQPGALNYGQALALSTLLMLATSIGMLAIERFRIADIGEF
ncbi:ABC transporter permease [Chloroflexota bacterium]